MQFDQIEAAMRSAGLSIKDMVEPPLRAEQMAPLPTNLLNGGIGTWLKARHPTGDVWRHQGIALNRVCAGRNVVVATGTASGKSRVFQYAALHAAVDTGRRTLVLYPVKALAADQLNRWRKMVTQVGLPPTALARIDGNVDPPVRKAMLDAAKIVLMTPDVCQAWLMKRLNFSEVRRFLTELQYVVLDEAHVYEGIFGSNTAFMLRRLISAKQALCPEQPPLQFIVTTATIKDPAAQMELLVGQPFELVGEADDGSPTHLRRLYLATSTDLSSKGEVVLSDLLNKLAPVAKANDRRIIAFHDSRQGTERVGMQVAAKDILAYRSGYEEADRARIEDTLRRGEILGIVSTSAMELGIDVPGLDIGLNLGIPRTRKQFRQRFGRVGRSAPGAFILLASSQTLRNLRGNLEAYLKQDVEPSHLYLGNRFMQFAQARCMREEITWTAKPKAIATSPPGVPVWPDGFDQQLANAGLLTQDLSREYHFIAGLAKRDPHLSFPLRLFGERNFELLPPGQGQSQAAPSAKNRIGNISVGQALREAYPGAAYRHQGSYYRVLSWDETKFQPHIIIEKRDGLLDTSPFLERELSFGSNMIIAGRLLMAPGGYVAETDLIVVETVRGFEQRMNGAVLKRYDYKPGQSKRREIRTTGVVIAFDDHVIDEALRSAGLLHAIGETLKVCFTNRHNIESNDVELSVGECALVGPQGPMRIANSIVIYDAAYGGMRLTEKLFDDFLTNVVDDCFADHLREQFETHVWPMDVLQSILDWLQALSVKQITALPAPTWPDHVTTFFAPGSVVSVFDGGRSEERQLKSTITMTIDGRTQLYYKYGTADAKGAQTKLVPASLLQPSGHKWTVLHEGGSGNSSP